MSDPQLTIKYMRLDEAARLRWGKNPKLHDIGAIVESIRRYGFIDPPGFDETLGAFTYGNGRDEALEWMYEQSDPLPPGVLLDTDGMWKMPYTSGVNQATPEQAEALAIDHNNLTMAGGPFQPYQIAEMWGDGYTDILAGLATADALPITVDGDALDGLLKAMEQEPEARPGDDDGPSLDTPTRVQPGDVWRVGEHLVCCLDSTDRGAVEKWARGVTFVVADPPYGIKAVDENSGQTGGLGKQGKWGYSLAGGSRPGTPMKTRKYAPVAGDESTDTAIDAALLALDIYPKATQFWWGANNYANALPPSTCWIVWDKDTGDNAFADCELAWSNHTGAVRKFDHKWNGVMRATECGEARTHPTQKPVALFLWLYERYGKPGDVIFDPFLGSGPSLKAAHRMGNRTVIGFELSPAYCDHILEWAASNGLPCERAE